MNGEISILNGDFSILNGDFFFLNIVPIFFAADHFLKSSPAQRPSRAFRVPLSPVCQMQQSFAHPYGPGVAAPGAFPRFPPPLGTFNAMREGYFGPGMPGMLPPEPPADPEGSAKTYMPAVVSGSMVQANTVGHPMFTPSHSEIATPAPHLVKPGFSPGGFYGRFVLPSGHARPQPARAFPAQTVQTAWTLLSTGSVVVLVLQALQRFLPGFFMNRAVRKAGQRLERTEPAPARPVEEEYIKDSINSPQRKALSTPSFLVVSGSQGIGKSAMLNNLMCEHVKNGKRVLPLDISVRPGEDLKLNEALPQALQAVDLPRYYPSNVEFLLERVNETSKHRTGSAVVVYLQLTTKSRGDKLSRDACDDIDSTLGAFARNITYDNAVRKLILEVSVSAVAGIIKERFDMSDLVVVRPLLFEDFTSVVKEMAKQGNDFRTLNKVLADDEIEEVLKHYYIRTGGNFRALGEILRNVSREGQKGADAVIEQVEQWCKRRVEPIEKKLDDQEVKGYLLKVMARIIPWCCVASRTHVTGDRDNETAAARGPSTGGPMVAIYTPDLGPFFLDSYIVVPLSGVWEWSRNRGSKPFRVAAHSAKLLNASVLKLAAVPQWTKFLIVEHAVRRVTSA
eukprot:s1188_g6.t2